MDDVLVQARAGDLDAWLAVCVASVRGLAWSFSQSSGIEVDDLLQEVSIKLYRKADKVLATRNPMIYAKRVARNAMIDQYRKVARRRRKLAMVSLEGRRAL
jgi:RNA polymerase sigma factor (sigma-70 family)